MEIKYSLLWQQAFSSKDENVVLGKLLHKSVTRRTEIFTPNFCHTNTIAHFHLLCSLKQINVKHSQCLDTLLLFTTVVYLASFTTRNFSSHPPASLHPHHKHNAYTQLKDENLRHHAICNHFS